MSSPLAVVETSLRVQALDGYSLGATLYIWASLDQPPTVALFSCGGAIPAARYAHFARFLAANGVPVLIYDYRGIGTSRPPQLRALRARAEDWSELDSGGAIAYLRSRYPRAELIGIAHSIGGLLVGGAPNVSEIERFLFICAHTGYFKDYMPRYRWPMAVVWHIVMPALTRMFGYFPARFLGLGENIPAGVALQWAARRSPDFRPEASATDTTRANSMIARYRTVAGEVLVLGFTDDAFATAAGADRLIATFPRLRCHAHFFAPHQVGMSSVGHFGFFSRSAEAQLWPLVLPFVRTGKWPNFSGSDITGASQE